MSNKIYEHTNMISNLHNDKTKEYIKGIYDLQEIETDEDISVYRVIEIDNNSKVINIFDYEYHDDWDRNSLVLWQSELDYDNSKQYIEKYGQMEFLNDVDDYLKEDFSFIKTIQL